MFDVKDCIAFLSNQGGKVVGESMNRYFEERGSNITRVQLMALHYINQELGLSQKQLAEKMQIKEPTLLHLIDRLEKEGLVVRQYNRENRRIRSLYLTEEGKKKYKDVLPLVAEFNKWATRGIAPEDMDTFKNVLNHIIENVCEVCVK